MNIIESKLLANVERFLKVCKIRFNLFGLQGGGNYLENRVNWVELWCVGSSEKVGDVVMWMVGDILQGMSSASGTQLEASPECARSTRVLQSTDVGSPF